MILYVILFNISSDSTLSRERLILSIKKIPRNNSVSRGTIYVITPELCFDGM